MVRIALRPLAGDSLNQLVRENNAYINKTIAYTYDNGGNILFKKEYAYTTGVLGTPTKTNSYNYADSNWKDKLTLYNGQNISYDSIGNPLSYRDGMSFTWDYGRSLKTINKTGLSATYYYNQDGIRTSKKVNGVTTNYYLDNENRIISQSNGTTKLNFFYDEKGELFGFNKMASNGYIEKYFYVRNAQGDIIEIINEEGASVCKYVYDTWGNVTSITGVYADSLAVENPFRYRGYYYDNESGLYYLQSRYYDPTTGRFLNADDVSYLGAGGILGYNLYTYCQNNSVMLVDQSGYLCYYWLSNSYGPSPCSNFESLNNSAYCNYHKNTNCCKPKVMPNSVLPFAGAIKQNDYPNYAGTTISHRGTDFKCSTGTIVHAVMGGKVIDVSTKINFNTYNNKAYTGMSTYGIYIKIQLDSGKTMIYAHLSYVNVKVNDRVNMYDVIGKSGNTGNSSGPHLHFEVNSNGKPVNPFDYLPK